MQAMRVLALCIVAYFVYLARMRCITLHGLLCQRAGIPCMQVTQGFLQRTAKYTKHTSCKDAQYKVYSNHARELQRTTKYTKHTRCKDAQYLRSTFAPINIFGFYSREGVLRYFV